jgi:hypothetical protein
MSFTVCEEEYTSTYSYLHDPVVNHSSLFAFALSPDFDIAGILAATALLDRPQTRFISTSATSLRLALFIAMTLILVSHQSSSGPCADAGILYEQS